MTDQDHLRDDPELPGGPEWDAGLDGHLVASTFTGRYRYPHDDRTPLPRVGTWTPEPLRSRTWSTLLDALMDVHAAEAMGLLADIAIDYRDGSCSFAVRVYEAPPGYAAEPDAELAVDPCSGDIVAADA